MVRVVAVVVLVVATAGCNAHQAATRGSSASSGSDSFVNASAAPRPVAVRWERPESTQEDLKGDIARCEYEVAATVPPARYHPFAANIWVVLQDQINISETEARARSLMEMCIVARGWQKVTVYADGTTDRPAPVEFAPRKLQ